MDSDKDGKQKESCHGLWKEPGPKTKKHSLLIPKTMHTALQVSNRDINFSSVSLLTVTECRVRRN